MTQLLNSSLSLIIGVTLSLAGLILAVRLLPFSRGEPAEKVPLRGRLHQALLILAIAASGVGLLLLGVAWARQFRAPTNVHVWGLLALGALQIAVGVVLFAIGRPGEGALNVASRAFRRWMLPLIVLVAGLAWVWLGLAAVLSPARSGATPAATLEPGRRKESRPLFGRRARDQDDGRQNMVGIVRDGEFWVLTPAGSAGLSARLTGIAMQESVSPESREIDLRPYEGSAILVHGRSGGGWIYEAEVIDQGGPLLTEIAEQVFR